MFNNNMNEMNNVLQMEQFMEISKPSPNNDFGGFQMNNSPNLISTNCMGDIDLEKETESKHIPKMKGKVYEEEEIQKTRLKNQNDNLSSKVFANSKKSSFQMKEYKKK